MKRIRMKQLGFLMVPFIILIAECNKPKENLTLKDLPPITQVGANTFGCLVNNKGFIPQASSNESNVLSASYGKDYADSTYKFFIKASDAANTPITQVKITLDTSALVTGKKIVLNVNDLHALAKVEWIVYDITGVSSYEVIPPLTGQIDLIKVDKTKKVIAGTFFFSGLNNLGKTVQISQGRFDVRF